MAEIPTYSQYRLVELYQALNTIDPEKYPDTFAALEHELNQRNQQSRFELEDCYSTLNKDKWPTYAARLRQQIDEAIDPSATVGEPESIFGGFWRRFWAYLIDADAVLGLLTPLVFLMLMGSREMAMLTAVLTLISAAYFVLTHAYWGRSIGKAILGLRVLANNGEPLSLRQSTLRYSIDILVWTTGALIVSLAFLSVPGSDYAELNMPGRVVIGSTLWLSHPLAIPFIAISFLWTIANVVVLLNNQRKRAIHDYVGGSCVVREIGATRGYPVGKIILLLALPAIGSRLTLAALDAGPEVSQLLTLSAIVCYIMLAGVLLMFTRAAFSRPFEMPHISP